MESGRAPRRRRKYGTLNCYSNNRPQVYIKLRPTTDHLNLALRALPDGKTLELQSVDPSRSPHYFESDGILQDVSQSDLFASVVEPVISRALEGVSGVILSLGPQGSGKSFSFYGDLGKFENRGLLPRAFEKIFQFVELSRNDVKYGIKIGMVALRKNRIRDLISLSPYELKTVGDNGPNGMMLQPIECAEQGYALLMRGVAGLKLITSDPQITNFHTLIFIDIEGERILSAEDQKYFGQDAIKFTSRLTFAKIASLPGRQMPKSQPRPVTAPTQLSEKIIRSDDCVFITPAMVGRTGGPGSRDDTLWRGPSSAGVGCHVQSPLFSETISVRRDLLFLEELFIRMRELQEAHRCYRKVISKDARMEKVAEEPEVTISSQHLRQNKLCHCLRDLVSSRNEVRLLLHLRPESDFLQNVQDGVRFAARLRSIPRSPPFGNGDKMTTLNGLRQEIQILREELERVSKSARGELAEGAESLRLSPSHSELLQRQAVAYMTGTLEHVDVETKAEVKFLLENFRTLYATALNERKGTRIAKQSSRPSKDSTNSNSKEILGNQPPGFDKKFSRMIKRDKSGKRKTRRTKGGFKTANPSAEMSSISLDVVSLDVLEKIGEEEETTLKEEHAERSQEEDKMGFGGNHEVLEAAFLKTETGSRLSRDVAMYEGMLSESTAHHAEELRKAQEFFKTVTEKEVEFEGIQKERHARGFDFSGNLVVPKNEKELLAELKVLKEGRNAKLAELRLAQIEIGKQKSGLNSFKTEFDTQFQLFCLERFSGIPGEKEKEAAERSEELKICELFPTHHHHHHHHEEMAHAEFCNLFGILGGGHEDPSRNFSALQRAAQEQAKEILHYYALKPTWKNNYK